MSRRVLSIARISPGIDQPDFGDMERDKLLVRIDILIESSLSSLNLSHDGLHALW
jgi:hypothetical protein